MPLDPQPCISAPNENGDCWRACIASILGVPAHEVPNFAHTHPGWDEMLAAAREWLRGRGLALFRTYCSAGWTLEKLIKWFSADNPDAPFILIGRCAVDPTDNHAVVVMNGSVVHDPSNSGVDGPVTHGEGHEQGWWWIDVICLAGARP